MIIDLFILRWKNALNGDDPIASVDIIAFFFLGCMARLHFAFEFSDLPGIRGE